MQPEIRPLYLSWQIARKELTLFFSSPVAWLFLACFAAVELFVFFWGEAFFARNIADVRPLFSWMPLLLMFLTSTLTMKVWSEERRLGTLEAVMTQGIGLWVFVAGKFVGCLVLLLLALLVTLPLPLTVASIASLDWGPVWAGYLATLLLGSAYLAMGLFVSARSDNQIVSLLLSLALCGSFYLIGHSSITDLLPRDLAALFSQLGTGARFDAITRGMLDLRDLYYYLALTLVFLLLNCWVLEKQRFAVSSSARARRLAWLTTLAVLNLLTANLWLSPLHQLRYDSTAGKQFSLSDATRQQLAGLQEPLLIRAYFSAQTHPLLAPLVPQLQDLLKEYQVAGGDKVRVEVVDPASEPELEQEANQKYGIEPVPFQVADRYQAAIVSSYFHLLVQYGTEHQVLGFRELIEVKSRGEASLDVQLRNPELDITKGIKQVQQQYQAGGNLFDNLRQDVKLTAYVSADARLPAELKELKTGIHQVLADYQQQAGDRFSFSWVDPEAKEGAEAKRLTEQLGLQPLKFNLLSAESFWFSLVLQQGEQLLLIPLDDLSKAAFERNLTAALKRFSTGFRKTVALVSPTNAMTPYGNSEFSQLQATLGDNFNLQNEDITDGQVSGDADVLVLVAPENLSETQVFAIDQFLMQGGTVIAATSPYKASLSSRQLSVRAYDSGLKDWLAHYGVSQQDSLVLDSQHAALPIPVNRQVGGFSFREMRLLPYPWFVDIREQGMNADAPLLAGLPQLVMPWASAIEVDSSKQQGRTVTPLLYSSNSAWQSKELNVMPVVDADGNSSYPSGSEPGQRTLGLMLQGRFDSYFAGKAHPLLPNSSAETETADKDNTSNKAATLLTHSAQSARLLLLSSNDLFSDAVVQLVGGAQGTSFLNNLQLLLNSLDYALSDPALLEIRGRGQFNRTLPPLDSSTQHWLEYLNYGLVLGLIGLIAVVQRLMARRRLQKLQLALQ
ncbi:Gldg family protein [Rheinheimera sp.]|uniref:Gldg family protein n=1 Tax=Rheinheimera sp. TaxID=1869214 RepID=UPI00307DADE0